VLFIAWSLALLVALVRSAWVASEGVARFAAAGAAAALAAVLALAVQTDAYGVPWLAYCLWWIAGALVMPREGPARPAA
jgi:hypothetical protein